MIGPLTVRQRSLDVEQSLALLPEMSNRQSPPRRRYEDDKSGSYSRRGRDSRDDRGSYHDSLARNYGRSPNRNYESRSSANHRDYNENDREREREKDRERYDRRDRDRVNGSSHRSRRSASPTSRDSRPRGGGDSRSRSPKAVDKSKPDFKPSGLLAAETNTVKATDGTSTVLKYNEPPEARKPVVGWRLYGFKDSEQVGAYVRQTNLCAGLKAH